MNRQSIGDTLYHDIDDHSVPDTLMTVAKKDDDMIMEYTDPTGFNHEFTADAKVLHDLQRAGDDYFIPLDENGNDERPTLPMLWMHHVLAEERRPMIVPVEIVHLTYLANAMFTGGLLLCLGTFWMYAFQLLPQWGHYDWVRYMTMGSAWGIFGCLYCMLMWIDTKTAHATVALIVAWQMSAVFGVAALSAFIQHQAPFHLCAIVFLQSIMVVIYTYTQKRELSASLAFLLMFMITVLQWAVATFVLAPTGMHADGHVPAITVLLAGIAISIYHAFHIRYITHHDTTEYNLSDKSRLEAIRDLYTSGLRWLATGILDVHWKISQLRSKWCCRRCGGRTPSIAPAVAV